MIKNTKSAHGSVRPNSGRGAVEDAAETRLAQLQRRFRVLSACNRTLIHAVSEHELLTDICRAMVEVGG